MRVCIEIATGKLIEAQSGGEFPSHEQVSDAVKRGIAEDEFVSAYQANNLATLSNNAIAQGYAESDIEVKFVSETEYQNILSNQPVSKIRKKLEVKAVARRKIIAIANEDKQRNYIARFSELLGKKSEGTLTQSEVDEMTFLRGIWARVKAIRTSSDAIEAEIDALATANEASAYVIEPNVLWSE